MELYNHLIQYFPFHWLPFAFMRNAFLAVLILAPLVGLLGTIVVNNRMAFFSDALGHSTLAGIAIGILLGMRNLLGIMLFFSIFLALTITFLKNHTTTSSDTILSVISSTTMALGIVLLSVDGGFSKYTAYLIGDLLSITQQEIQLLSIVLVIILVYWVFFYNKLLLTSLNASLAGSRNIKTFLIDASFSVITALVVTVSIQWVGVLIINSLLVLPAAAARNIASNTRQYTLYSVLIAIVSSICGLILSFYWSTASSATIVLVAAIFYLLSTLLRLKFFPSRP